MKPNFLVQSHRMVFLLVIAGIFLCLNLSAHSDFTESKVINRLTAKDQGTEHQSFKYTTPKLPDIGVEASQLVRPLLEVGDKDPFATESIQQLPATSAVSAPTFPAAAAPSQTPPLNLQYAGRITAPDGSHAIYATYEELPLKLSLGLDLPNGYRVISVSDGSVEFSHPALDRTTRLEIPPTQKYQTR
jgi:hypothetical protein